ncbi:sulfatase/phosphatase domain-containing protein [Alteromonas sp. M12]|uniref:sulfatase/phosphatase domain-containing protein n=1 Tax=Alteromonas sp. M12 TaxID=3135644 RepID=UPI00319E679C
MQSYSVDEQVRRLVAKLEELDLLDNTIIIYTSDNGRYHGSRGLYDKAIQYDEAIKQPLIVFDGRASKENHGRRIDAMVSSADIAPTILSLAGLDIPPVMKGHDLSPLMEGKQDMTKWREGVLTENFFIQELLRTKGKQVEAKNNEVIKNNRSYRSRGIRTKQYQYFEYFEHSPVIEELYELANDPDEQNNLVSDPNYKSTLAEMRKKTAQLYAQALQ